MGSQLKMSYPGQQTYVRTQPTANPLKPKPRPANQGHFDPEELTQRLYIVLADQKAAHSARKRARADAEARLRDARSWTSRHSNKEAAGSKSKEATRETVTAAGGAQPSLKFTGGSSSTGEPSRHKSSSKQRKDLSSKDAPRSAPPDTATPAAAAAAGVSSSTYHHVPKEAAKQFQLTTTVDGMRDGVANSATSNTLPTKKLSKQALMAHLAAVSAHSHHAPPPPRMEVSASPVKRLLKDRKRVDEWRLRIPDEAVIKEEQQHHAEGDREAADDHPEQYHVAPQYQEPQQDKDKYSFQAELARMRHEHHHPHAAAEDQRTNNRRNSTGDILERAAADGDSDGNNNNRLSMVIVGSTSLGDVLEDSTETELARAVEEHRRVDWTQSDEQRHQQHQQHQRAAEAAAEAAAATTTVATGAASAATTTTSPPAGSSQKHKPALLLTPLLRKADSIWTLRGRLASGSKAAPSAATASAGQFPVRTGEEIAPPVSTEESPKEPRSPRGGFFAKFKR